ncbi:MAG: hypothetical protein ACR2GX_00480 [Candidatus Dormibacteria bacterium]
MDRRNNSRGHARSFGAVAVLTFCTFLVVWIINVLLLWIALEVGPSGLEGAGVFVLVLLCLLALTPIASAVILYRLKVTSPFPVGFLGTIAAALAGMIVNNTGWYAHVSVMILVIVLPLPYVLVSVLFRIFE